MCLAIPSKIIEINDQMGVIDVAGVQRETSLLLLKPLMRVPHGGGVQLPAGVDQAQNRRRSTKTRHSSSKPAASPRCPVSGRSARHWSSPVAWKV